MFQVATVSLNYITPLFFKVSGGVMKLSTRMVSLYKGIVIMIEYAVKSQKLSWIPFAAQQ